VLAGGAVVVEGGVIVAGAGAFVDVQGTVLMDAGGPDVPRTVAPPVWAPTVPTWLLLAPTWLLLVPT